jgi:hypothetical protein
MDVKIVNGSAHPGYIERPPNRNRTYDLRIERTYGPVVLGLQVRPTDWELREFGTNPSERLARRRRTRHSVAALLDEADVLVS